MAYARNEQSSTQNLVKGTDGAEGTIQPFPPQNFVISPNQVRHDICGVALRAARPAIREGVQTP
jgi:hypothetical protein